MLQAADKNKRQTVVAPRKVLASSGGRSALYNPTSYSHSIGRSALPTLPFSTITNGVAQDAALNLPASMAGTVRAISRGSTHAGMGPAKTNAYVTAQAYVDYRHPWKPNHCYKDQLCFIATKEDAQQTMGNHPGIARRVAGVSWLNWFFQTQKGRETYGNPKSYIPFLRDWQYYGMQFHDHPGDATMKKMKGADVQTFVVGGEVRLPDYWQAIKGVRVTQFSKLYFLLRFYPYVSSAEKLIREMQVGSKRKLVDKEDIQLLHDHKIRKKRKLDDQGGAINVEKTTFTEWYCRLEPYLSVDGRPPPEELYIDRDNHVYGHAFYIGKVTNFHPKHNPNMFADAQDFVFPANDDDTYIAKQNQISELRVQLAIR